MLLNGKSSNMQLIVIYILLVFWKGNKNKYFYEKWQKNNQKFNKE